MKRKFFAGAFVLLAVTASPGAAQGPQPPCGAAPVPPYAEVDAPPNVRLWDTQELGPSWRPATCTGWGDVAFDQLVGLAARFRSPLDAAGLLERFGRVSQLTDVRYWSVSNDACRELIDEAYALAGPGDDRPRRDFAADELAAGQDLYFYQDDNGPAGGAAYRLRVREASPDRLVLETANVGTVSMMLVPLFEPGELRAFYILEQDEPGVWNYYSLSGATAAANPMAGGHEASYINRALALYGDVAGLAPCSAPLRVGEGGPAR